MASKPATRARAPAPEIFNEFEAASYIGMSAAYLRGDRCFGRGGPAFLRLGRTIRYDRRDLDAWLAARRVDRGSRGRRGSRAASATA
jgi:hypothetical protein